MEPTSLSQLEKTGNILSKKKGLVVKVDPKWIIENEDRLSYATIIRLVECCREYHWNIDVVSKSHNSKLDSILMSLTANFLKPIIAGNIISIEYRIKEVRTKGYSLIFIIKNVEHTIKYAEVEMVSVICDPDTLKPLPLPKKLSDYLLRLSHKN